MIEAIQSPGASPPSSNTVEPRVPPVSEKKPDDIASPTIQVTQSVEVLSGQARIKAIEAELNRRIERLFSPNLKLRIEADKGTDNFVYKSIDRKTGEVAKQWPAEEILRMMAFFNELDGVLIDKRA